MIDGLLPASPDHEQIIKGIGYINANLPASSTTHFITSPFPSMRQQIYVITVLFPCLKYASLLKHLGDIIFSILGLGEGDTISHHSQEVAQGVFACKW